MLARGIRSYHRPAQLGEALDLAAQGATPLAGGTRLLASPSDVPNVLDLSALGWSEIAFDGQDLHLGALTTLQDVIDAPEAWQATAGLLPLACRAHSASRMIRGMATVGGEAVQAAGDSEVAAALLALNAVFVLASRSGPVEVPALRFLRDPRSDLAGGVLLKGLMIPGDASGGALERLAVAPSAPSILAVAVALSFSQGCYGRARIALTGLEGPPSRVPEAEAKIEGTRCDDNAIEASAAEAAAAVRFRTDAHASAHYRRRVAHALVARALAQARRAAASGERPSPPRSRVVPSRRVVPALPYFTSGRVEMSVNGALGAFSVEARATLLHLLRQNGMLGTKHGCESGECGACTVLLDGRPVLACLTLALRAQGRSVLTVEGIGTPDALHPVQEAFVRTGAIQCGYCTPAMVLCAKALLDGIPDPTDEEVRDALAGCLCRCTGYVKPVEAVRGAARALRAELAPDAEVAGGQAG
jgi:aerobic-type carbon monoxide dehydrogenase small subunit (CoxS/CutS family)/CO/xanthine dehydrogenase FAD-binding subunit